MLPWLQDKPDLDPPPSVVPVPKQTRTRRTVVRPRARTGEPARILPRPDGFVVSRPVPVAPILPRLAPAKTTTTAAAAGRGATTTSLLANSPPTTARSSNVVTFAPSQLVITLPPSVESSGGDGFGHYQTSSYPSVIQTSANLPANPPVSQTSSRAVIPASATTHPRSNPALSVSNTGVQNSSDSSCPSLQTSSNLLQRSSNLSVPAKLAENGAGDESSGTKEQSLVLSLLKKG